MEIARGDFYLQPNDRYTKRQQDLLDMDEDVGSEDDWKYMKADDGDLQSEDSFRSVDSQHALGDGPTPPPPPPYRDPPTPRYRGPPAKPIDDPTGTVVPPPPFRPLPPVPGPPAQPRPDWEEFERYFKSKSDAEIPDELRELMTTRWNSSWNSPEFLGRSTDCPPEQMGDLTAPDNGRTVVTQPWDYPFIKMAVLKASYKAPSEDHVNHQRFKDARTIANTHLSAAADPHLSRGNAELLGPHPKKNRNKICSVALLSRLLHCLQKEI